MSAPPLARAGPIPGSGAFYVYSKTTGKIPLEEAPHAAETLFETGEATQLAPKDTEDLEVAAPPPGGGFEIAIDLNSVQPPYIGEDARLTQLRNIYTLFRNWSRKSSGSGTRISEDTLRFLPRILRVVIQFFQEMQKQNERLQRAQETLLAERRQMEVRISSLQKDNETFQDAKREFKDEIDVLKREVFKVEGLYTGTKAQKDSLEEQLTGIKARAASNHSPEDSNNKRRRQA